MVSFPEEEIAVAVPVSLDLVLMVDAGADDLFIDFGISAQYSARAVPLTIFDHLACKSPDDCVKLLGIRIQHKSVLCRIPFHPVPDQPGSFNFIHVYNLLALFHISNHRIEDLPSVSRSQNLFSCPFGVRHHHKDILFL